MTSTVLYLVRHGAIVCGAGKTYVGQIDAPLSEEGVEHAWALRRWLIPVEFSRIISSDLSRTQHTCRIIAGAAAHSMEAIPAFREISLGTWEGCSFSEIQRRFPEEYAARGNDIENWRPPGGESFADCRVRVMEALRGILDRSTGNVLLVGHAGVNRIILTHALGIPASNIRCIGQDYGCLNIIEFAGKRTRLKLLNFTPPTVQALEEITLIPDLAALQAQGT